MTDDAREMRINSLIEELSARTIADLVFLSVQVIITSETLETMKAKLEKAGSGSWSFNRTLHYADRLRNFEQERLDNGKTISQLLQTPPPRSSEEIERSVAARISATHLSGDQELVFHFMAICIQHIRSLLLVTAESVGYEIPQTDSDFLDEFRFLRNHYEHWHERLPGNVNDAGLVLDRVSTRNNYAIQAGINTDAFGRLLIVEPKKTGSVLHTIDLTQRGVAKIDRILQETTEGIKRTALANVRNHFYQNLDQPVPARDSVPHLKSITIGGPARIS